MRISLARANLMYQKRRTVVAAAGVSFALILIFMQLGFLAATEATAVLLYQKLDFDLVLVSSEYVEINRAGTFSSRRLYQAETCPAVQTAVPLYLGHFFWRNLEEGEDARLREWAIMVIGIRPDDSVVKLAEVEQERERLKQQDTVLIDRRSRRYFGLQVRPDGKPVVAELDGHKVSIVGQFTLGTGFGANGMLLTSERTFAGFSGMSRLDSPSLGLLKLHDGASPEVAKASLCARLPEDVSVFTRAELEARERRFWVKSTSVGTIFTFGVIVALIVGVAFVYQVISSDIANRLGEYATLKAVGYSTSYLSRVVLQQALVLALLGYIPGLLFALALYEWTASHVQIPIGMTWSRAIGVLTLAILMCASSGLLALRKVWAADPAELF